MIEQFKPWYSLDDIAERVSEVNALTSEYSEPLIENEDVGEYLGVLERRVARSGFRWSTGRRAKHEQHDLEEGIDVYTEFLGELTYDLIYKTFTETGSMDKAKQAGLALIEESKLAIFTEDINMRFEGSHLERFKKNIAQRPIVRLLVPAAFYGSAAAATNEIIARAGEASSSVIDLNPAQGGAVIAIWVAAYKMATRSLPRQVGEQVKNRTNVHLDRYVLKNKFKRNGDGADMPFEELLPAHYAEDHIFIPLKIIDSTMMRYVVDDSDDIEPMVAHVMEVAKELMYASYDMELYKDERPFHKRMLGKFALVA